MLKKIATLCVIGVFALSFSGCEKKSTVSVSSSATPIPDALQKIDSGVSASGSAVATSSATSDEQSFINDAASIDSTFQQNYQVALEDAQKSLKSGVKYCGAKITFYGATLSQDNKQSFVFYSNEFSNDYYWVVSLNGYQDNLKTRAFAAKKDMTSEIKCMSATGSAPGTFSDIYSKVISGEQFKKTDPGIIAETTLETMDSGWSVTVINNAGQSVIVDNINPTATKSVTTQSTMKSPIATGTKNNVITVTD